MIQKGYIYARKLKTHREKNTYHKPRLVLYALSFSSILMFSCSKDITKEIDSEKRPVAESNRLKFNTYEDFRKIVALAQEKGYQKVPQILAENRMASSKFISLRRSADLVEEPSTAIRTAAPYEENQEPSEIIEELVPDPVFAELLDDRAEIEVQGKVYKITEYGTYVYDPAQESEVLNIIAGLEANSVELTPEDRMLPQETLVTEDLYQYPSGIQRYDSYVDIQTSYTPVTPPPTTAAANPNDPPNPNFLPQSVYDGFPAYNYDAHTWAGGLIQDIFGRTKAHHENFDSKNRVKVNFYNVDFMVYASAGVNVKMQRKGWTGIWRKLDTEELRIGWDALAYEVDLSNMPLANTPKPQSYDIDFSKVKFSNFEFDVKGFHILGEDLSTQLTKQLNDAKNKAFQQGLKLVWEEVKKIAPSQWRSHDNYTKQFRIIIS